MLRCVSQLIELLINPLEMLNNLVIKVIKHYIR
jgi:hypothetical protein